SFKMDGEEEVWQKLDAEFDQFVVDMEPRVLKLQHGLEQQRCALWIKKRREPSVAGTGTAGRKNRNLYAKLLLHMLKRGVLEVPFTEKPEQGALKPLPSDMSIYLDEPNSESAQSNSPDFLSDWVMGELGNSESKQKESSLSTSFTYGETLKYSKKSTLKSHSVSPHQRNEDNLATPLSDHRHKPPVSSDDSDIEAHLNSWDLGVRETHYFELLLTRQMTPKADLGISGTFCDEETLLQMHEKKLHKKMKILEGKCHEEKLKLQQKHNSAIQKILDRKNEEIEILKSSYEAKQNEAEETIRKLESEVQTLVRELQVVREVKEEQIMELKMMCEQSIDPLNNEWEKRFHNVAEMEKKFGFQKKQEDVQELLKDITARIHQMEDCFKQTKSTNEEVKKLKARVQQLTVEAENSNLQHQKLSQQKTDAEQRYQVVCAELQEMKARHSLLHKKKDCVTQEYERNIQQLQRKFDVDINAMKQELAVSAAKNALLISAGVFLCLSKENLVSLYVITGFFLENNIHSEKKNSSIDYVLILEILAIQNDFAKERQDTEKKIHKLEESLKEKEEQLTRVTEVQRLQAQQADAALEEFKRQVGLNQEVVCAKMKQQVEQAEAHLSSRLKSLLEKQSKESSGQLEDLKKRYEQQIVELKLEHEQEKTHLFQQHNAEKGCLVRDHEREIEELEKQHRAAMAEHESKTQECRKRDGQIICDMESQIHNLSEELIQVNAQWTQQLLELKHQWEEEKQRTTRDHETVMKKIKMEAEKKISDLKKLRAAEAEALDKATSRLRQTEQEYSQKLATSSQTIDELKTTICSLKEENSQQKLAAEQHLQEVLQRFEDKKQQLKTDNDRAIK
ncbi:CE112 protein, partial [Piaya cayana]|nr:CE112 protein [Piaya cayana]